jgi:hypothetical protein
MNSRVPRAVQPLRHLTALVPTGSSPPGAEPKILPSSTQIFCWHHCSASEGVFQQPARPKTWWTNRTDGPADAMQPCSNELAQLGFQVILSCKVGDFQPLTWENAKPLVDLIHPRAMHGPAVYNQARMRGEPRGALWPRMGADVVAHEMKHREVRLTLAFPRCQKGQACLQSCAIGTVPIDLAGARSQGRKRWSDLARVYSCAHRLGGAKVEPAVWGADGDKAVKRSALPASGRLYPHRGGM